MSQKIRTQRRAIVPTWIVIGMSIIMIIAVCVLAVFNYNREKSKMQQMLNEKGAALIKSFEAGTRTGMMGRFGSEARLQTLLTETASQEDILYIVLVDKSGKVLAHNDSEQIGQLFISPHTLTNINPTDKVAWRTVDQNGQPVAFEVFKKFLPIISPNSGGPEQSSRIRNPNGRGFMCQPGWMEGLPQERILDPDERPVIFIGMDANPYVEAMREDFKLTLVTTGIIFLLGMAGVVSLFWAQSYTRSKKLLQDSRAFASEMVANLPEGIIVTDPKLYITFINQIACEMLGLDTTKTVGENVTAALPENLVKLMADLSAEQRILDRELVFTGSDNQKLVVAATLTDIISEEGNFVGSMVILRDLTQIRRLQSTVQKQEKMVAIGNLAAGVAHEVRNPLSSIKGYATYFASLFEEDSEKKQAAEIMATEVERLNRVISELLEISRPSDLKRKETDIALLVSSSLRLVQQDAQSAGIQISTSFAEKLPTLLLDPDRITQALINLYINGIQAMPQGGKLTVECQEKDGGVELRIADSGMGMDEETRKKIFDPYFTTKNTGTGLGLAVVQKVVEAHGGTITVASSEGTGSMFTIFLPENSEKASES